MGSLGRNQYGYEIINLTDSTINEENKSAIAYTPAGDIWFPFVIVSGPTTLAARPNIYVQREINNVIESGNNQVNPGGTNPHLIYSAVSNSLVLAFEFNGKIYVREFPSTVFTTSLAGEVQSLPARLVDCLDIDDGGELVEGQQLNFLIALDRIDPPTNLIGASFTGSFFTLSWDPVVHTNLAGYNIYYGSGEPKTKVNSSIITTTSLSNVPLFLGVPYYATAQTISGVESVYSVPYIPSAINVAGSILETYQIPQDGQFATSLGPAQVVIYRTLNTDILTIGQSQFDITPITINTKIKIVQDTLNINDGKVSLLLTGIGQIEI